jgi:hypothetical protein
MRIVQIQNPSIRLILGVDRVNGGRDGLWQGRYDPR